MKKKELDEIDVKDMYVFDVILHATRRDSFRVLNMCGKYSWLTSSTRLSFLAFAADRPYSVPWLRIPNIVGRA